MHSWILSLLGLLLLSWCVPVAGVQQPIYRCIGAHGEPVFSGQPCGPPAAAQGPPDGAVQGGGSVSQCAASPQALRQAIADAFTLHDVNRFAGLLVWRGIGQASARTSLQALSQWLRQPLSGIATIHANGPPGSDAASAAPAPSGMGGEAPSSGIASNASVTGFAVSTGGGDGRTRDFGVVESGGCWWLTF